MVIRGRRRIGKSRLIEEFAKNHYFLSFGISVTQEIDNKIAKLNKPKYVSCCPVLIHVNGVTDSVVEKDYFYAIIDFTKFLL